MKQQLKKAAQGFKNIVFPNVCVCCGRENTQAQRQICTFCLENRFEDANPENEIASSDTLLPEGVITQHALWNFDKGGDLQHLLHQLKYERLTIVGSDLGKKLGERIKKNHFLSSEIKKSDAVLLPVPLHYLKFRYRGFNQAFKIAQGFEKVWPTTAICGIDSVVRTKNTVSQTGFTLQKRLQNMQQAFNVRQESAIASKLVIILDDVFTTGATTFELARAVLKSGASKIAILTIAQA